MIERFLVPFFLSMFCAFVPMIGMQLLGDPEPAVPWMDPAASDVTATWRHTADGWQDSSSWRVAAGQGEAKVQFVKNVHPLLVAAVGLFLSLAAIVLFDKEVVEPDALEDAPEEPESESEELPSLWNPEIDLMECIEYQSRLEQPL